MFSKEILTICTALALTGVVSADGLYSKGSAVLQVDGKSYSKLIAKSNQVSVSLLMDRDSVCMFKGLGENIDQNSDSRVSIYSPISHQRA